LGGRGKPVGAGFSLCGDILTELPDAEVERAAPREEQAGDPCSRHIVDVTEVVVEKDLGVESTVSELAVVRIRDRDRHVVRNIVVVMVHAGTIAMLVVTVVTRLAAVVPIVVFLVAVAGVSCLVIVLIGVASPIVVTAAGVLTAQTVVRPGVIPRTGTVCPRRSILTGRILVSGVVRDFATPAFRPAHPFNMAFCPRVRFLATR
jgi:hypothetical protein